MSHHERKNLNRSLTEPERARFVKTAAILSGAAVVFMSVMTILVHLEAIKLYPSNISAEVVKGYAGRVEFALRYQTLLVSWLLFNVFATIFGRVTNKALNPLDEQTEQHIQQHKNILTNSYEQIVLSVFAQLIYVSFAQPESILKVIPLVNIIQFIGRITFFAGYPFKRSFGFLCTSVPTIVLVLYNMYRFLSFLGLY